MTEDKPNSEEMLVAIIKRHIDIQRARNDGWYRIPVEQIANFGERWPPKWIAFYEPNLYGPDISAIRYYGRVESSDEVHRRIDLLPNEPDHPNADNEYVKIVLSLPVESLASPLGVPPEQHFTFISTTWDRFSSAETISDLFDSYLENLLWDALKAARIPAVRQYRVL